MVKADPRCDYYADLELKPSADAVEIKHQFKKLGKRLLVPQMGEFVLTRPTCLALKYHPDRNPGKELEFNSKFQAIQAAHEILADPQQRAKYDADRVRNGMLHSFASPARPNPPARAPASNFPPPPQRAAPNTANTNAHPPSSSGANRYSGYAKPEAGNPYRSTADEIKTRAQAFKAWEQMRHGQGTTSQSRPVPPRAPKTSSFQPGREAGSYPPRGSSQQAAADQMKGAHPSFPGLSRSNTTRGPKKGGFVPGTLGGDEPPARNTSAYFNISHGDRSDGSKSSSRPTSAEFRPPPPPGQRGAPSKRPDPLRPFKSQTGADDPSVNKERISTPYATAGGEKTYFSSSAFRTSSSSRDRSNQNEWYDSEPNSADPSSSRDTSAHHRKGHHSASPRMKSPLERAASEESTSSSSTDDSLREGVESLYTSTKQSQGPRTRDRYRFGNNPRTRFQPSDDTEEGEEGATLPPRSRSDAADEWRKADAQPWSAGKAAGKPDRMYPEGFMEHRLRREAEHSHSDAQNTSPPKTANVPASQNNQQRPLHRPRSWHDKYGATDRKHERENVARPATGDRQGDPSIFKNPPPSSEHASSHPPLPRSYSSESISVNFSPSDWHGKFTSNDRPEYFFEPQNNKQAPSSKGRRSPTKRMQHPQPPPHPHHPSQQAPHPAKPTIPNGAPPGKSDESTVTSQPEKYSPEKWASKFKPETLKWPPPPPPYGTPRVMSRKRSKTSKGPKIAQKRTTVPMPAAVDNAGGSASSNQESASGKTSGDDSGMDIDPVLTPPSGEKPSVDDERRSPGEENLKDTTIRPPVPPRPNAHSHGPPHATPHLNLGDLRNVAPFAQSQEGLKDLNDLTSALPFESRPSAQAAQPPMAQQLELPNPPKTPQAPEKLTQNSWERYIAQMRAYMFEWNAYNTKMLAHFNERQASVERTLKPEWMSAVGEGSERWGYKKYIQGIEEDFRVREHWDTSWEKHRDCMKALGLIRQRLLGSSIKVLA
ncbi:MAG: hypothetical protein Q9190_003721 [Brigantiaea leucoxantha]